MVKFSAAVIDELVVLHSDYLSELAHPIIY